MRSIFLLTFLFLSYSSVFAQDTLATFGIMDYQSTGVGDGWEEVVSFEGKFKIAVPGTVQHKSDTVLTDIGKLNYNVFFC